MTTQALVVRSSELENLTEEIVLEHGLATESLERFVFHAIRAGESLLKAQLIIPKDEWNTFCSDLPLARSSIVGYMRLAYYRDEIYSEATSIREALKSISLLPKRNGQTKQRISATDPLIKAARELVASGLTQYETAARLGVGQSTVSLWMKPDLGRSYRREAARRRDRMKSAAKRAALTEERTRLAKKVGGRSEEAYSLLRRTALELQGALEAAKTSDERAHLRSSLSSIYASEDSLVAALKERL